MFQVSIRHPLTQVLAITVSQDIPSGFSSISWALRNCSISYTTSTGSSECLARNGSTCSAYQQEEFLAATQQYEAAARQILVSVEARDNEAHDYNVQMQVRQLEEEADA